MKKCIHCGADILEEATICTNCGCYCDSVFVLTLRQEKQWFLTDSSIFVDVDDKKDIRVGSGKSVNINVTSGKHVLHCHASIRRADLTLNITKNTSVRLGWDRFSGKIEVWEE